MVAMKVTDDDGVNVAGSAFWAFIAVKLVAPQSTRTVALPA